MIWWIITALPFLLLLGIGLGEYIVAKKEDKDIGEVFAGLGIGLVSSVVVGFIGALVLSCVSFGFSDFKKTDEVTYTISEKSSVKMDGAKLTVIIEENGQVREFNVSATELTTVKGDKNEIHVDYFQRSAWLWVPWGTGTERFVTVTAGK